ncbi:unnamed protein product [Mytilus coruscus]|uniref:Uncharacterized protein n=1 Tax=Mytilus coruscus TaxID=42192 RepID=A0A6J8CAF6_MYTCO|nr:unnamed protein product [Mytilus coruscus]
MKGLIFALFAILFAESANGTRVLMRPYKRIQMCPDGNVPDQVFPDNRITCKPGPGTGKNVKCKLFHSTVSNFFQCPKYGYYSGWIHIGLKRMLKCCREPGIQYSLKDCRLAYNDMLPQGRIFRVDKGKFMTTSWSPDGGVTWFSYQCAYNTSPPISYKTFFKPPGNW